MKKKTLLSVILAVMLIISAASCDNKPAGTETDSTIQTTSAAAANTDSGADTGAAQADAFSGTKFIKSADMVTIGESFIKYNGIITQRMYQNFFRISLTNREKYSII